MRRRARVSAGGAALCLLSRLVFADDVVPFRVEYRAPEGCTDARGFARAVMARSRRARVGKGADSTSIVVQVENRDVGFSGRLHAEPPGGPNIDRAVRGDHCADVVDALAFIAALALDPDATSEPRELPESPPEAPEQKPTPAEPTLGWSFGAGAYVIPFGNAIPEASLGYGAFAEATSSGQMLAPGGYAFVERVPGGTVARQSGSASFSLVAGGAAFCPLRFPAAGTLFLRPCAGVWGGSVHAEAEGVSQPTQPTRGWLAAFGSIRGAWSVGGPFFLSAEAGVAVSLERQHYHFQNGESGFDTPALAGFSRIGAGIAFP